MSNVNYVYFIDKIQKTFSFFYRGITSLPVHEAVCNY